jgi:hypothetical protein
MDISQINSDFTEDTEPKDDKLMGLLKKAYMGEILCTMALAKLEAIKPFSDYKPIISDAYRNDFVKQTKDAIPSPMYVYAEDGKLIMSDDYLTYYLYKELNMSDVICIVIGETPPIDGVIYHGKPYKLPLPSI